LIKVSDEFMKHHPNPYIKTFIDLASSPDAQYAPRISIWGEYNDEMNVAIDRTMSLSASPPQALDAVESRLQWKMDRVMNRWDAVKDQRLKEWGDYEAK
jgi:maltose-binding protein MalE